MSDDPAHKAMLYFLEILMNSNGPLTISQLAGRFGSRSFSSEMRSACGGNEAGLKKFLLKYPSLFTVKGNMVSLFDGKSNPEEVPHTSQNSYISPQQPSEISIRRRSLPDVTLELQAVSFFQGKLVKKEEKWVQIKSLAGHLSQASMEIRNVVGPQLEFRNWLLRHPHIFEVQGELVGLRDGISAMSATTLPQRKTNYDSYEEATPTRKITFDEVPKVVKVPTLPPAPKTPPPQRKLAPKSPTTIRRSRSFSEKQLSALQSQVSEPVLGQEAIKRTKNSPLTMTANEYKAVIFLKEVIEKKPNGIKIVEIPSNYGTATDAVRTTIGWTKAEQEDFLRKNNSIFIVSEDESVSLVKNAKLNVIITGSKPQTQSVRTLNGKKGNVFHVAKLWGIIDLGKHEHVFFDKSIMRRPMDDLTRYFQTGETLYFNAVLAPKSSRAKWRATHVWREIEQQPSGSESDLSSNENQLLSPAVSVEEEINRFLPKQEEQENSPMYLTNKFSDAAPSSAGVVPVWNFRRGDDGDSQSESDRSLTMVPESYQMSESALKDISAAEYNKAISFKPKMNGVPAVTAGSDGKKYVDMACQTVSTGDVIATQLYYES